LLCTIVAVLAGAATTVTPATAAPAGTAALSAPVTGMATNSLGQTVNFAGQFALQSFNFANGQLSAVGQLTGTLTNTITGVVQTVNQLVSIPLTSINGTCQILHLTLGPIDLNLLGLVVHTNQIVLDITAQSGPGNLLGNLLCSVAHLLDSSASGQGLASVLNQLLRSL
jgi:hypothetical protein